MAGEITETGELYSPYVGLVYMFNLIVGTGALTMPKAFATAGWLVSLVLLVFLGFMSFVTTTFVMEAMAAANAQLRWKRMETHKEEDNDDDSSTASDSDILTPDSYERAEKQPILSVRKSWASRQASSSWLIGLPFFLHGESPGRLPADVLWRFLPEGGSFGVPGTGLALLAHLLLTRLAYYWALSSFPSLLPFLLLCGTRVLYH